MKTNKELIIAAQKGNQNDYTILLENIEKMSIAFIKPKINIKTDCEDIIQYILLAVHKSRHTYRPEQSFESWIYAIIRHKLIDYYEANKKKQNQSNDTELENIAAKKNTLVDQKINFDELTSFLTKEEKDIIRWAKIEGYSIKEVASFLKKSESATKVTIHRIQKKLQKIARAEFLLFIIIYEKAKELVFDKGLL